MHSPDQFSDVSDEDRMFHDLSDPVEDVQDYRQGGYHSIYLGDYLQNGRFMIFRKLGYRSYSTVWLAKDQMLVIPLVWTFLLIPFK
jgi:hypothetical protein